MPSLPEIYFVFYLSHLASLPAPLTRTEVAGRSRESLSFFCLLCIFRTYAVPGMPSALSKYFWKEFVKGIRFSPRREGGHCRVPISRRSPPGCIICPGLELSAPPFWSSPRLQRLWAQTPSSPWRQVEVGGPAPSTRPVLAPCLPWCAFWHL